MWITYAHTAAVSAVAAKYLARPQSQTLGLIGVGGPGRWHDAERITSVNFGVATSDVALGSRIYQLALDKGLGKTLDLF